MRNLSLVVLIAISSLPLNLLGQDIAITRDCIGCRQSISTFPHTINFEEEASSICQDGEDDFDWSTHEGRTTTLGTGPDGAKEGERYIYIESSSPNHPDKSAVFYTPCYDLSDKDEIALDFWFHMFGTRQVGSLTVEVSTDDGGLWTKVWLKEGDQKNQWRKATVDLSAYADERIKLKFSALTASYKSDIALDLIKVSAVEKMCIPGDPCDEGDPCIANGIYDELCNCIGEMPDADGDGVCDTEDQCPDSDDNLDENSNGIPDGCDCDSRTIAFANKKLRHQGEGYSKATLTLPEGANNVNFLISRISQSSQGGSLKEYTDRVDIFYVNKFDEVILYDTCVGNKLSKASVMIEEEVKELIIELSDVYEGADNVSQSIVFSDITYCAASCEDSDGDFICDEDDKCPGYDDGIDKDGDDIPDACDDCIESISSFPSGLLSHSGHNSTSLSMHVINMRNPAFTISGLGNKRVGLEEFRYVDEIVITYRDTEGKYHEYGTFNGQFQNTVEVKIEDNVSKISIALQNDYPGSVLPISVYLSDITWCQTYNKNFDISFSRTSEPEKLPQKDVAIYPNPATDLFYVQVDADMALSEVEVSIINRLGQQVYNVSGYADGQILEIGAGSLPNGVYMIRLKSGDRIISEPLIISK